MKRLFSFIMILLTAMGLGSEVYANSKTVRQLDEPGMRIDIPEEYTVLTKDEDSDTAELKEHLAWMKLNGVYLDAWNQNKTLEVCVTASDPAVDDFQILGIAALKILMPHFRAKYEEAGGTVQEMEIYPHKQAIFLKTSMNESGTDGIVDRILYYTVIAERDVQIEMRTASGAIRPEEEATLRHIVDSIFFTSDFYTMPTDKTEAFLYQDSEMGVSFMVPENWAHKTMIEEVEPDPTIFYTPFYLRTDLGMTISYERINFWDRLPDKARFGTTRRDWDHSLVDISLVAKIFDISPEEISSKSYGGKEYYTLQRTVHISACGIDAECPETACVRFENGYSYGFYLGGSVDQEYYRDFEALLNSVKYPDAPAPLMSDFTRQFLREAAIRSAVILVLYMLLRWKKAKQNEQEPANQSDDI